MRRRTTVIGDLLYTAVGRSAKFMNVRFSILRGSNRACAGKWSSDYLSATVHSVRTGDIGDALTSVPSRNFAVTRPSKELER